LTNSGYQYRAPPRIQIVGDGAGAEATCTIGLNNQIASVTIVNGGSGYLPIQFQSPVSAVAIFDNGKVENVQYR
jgi:hypothetical protein